ncbi:MAG: 4-hydroxythreonine-4-phosphate dehydrogenase PdxA [Spirochaetia bacterium]|jgi:4-hydroxy-L-threonine phosphate dehydrogenase PdxA|nr:4-hydroxythreonine-4-phosphate dehydrogenase PdxA [Spirochaetia bacterium]
MPVKMVCFGTEEIEEIIPAIELAKKSGIDATGPYPPDTVFSKARGGWFDIVVVMYHDQGHIPLKVIGFVYDKEKEKWDAVRGVNITLGLPHCQGIGGPWYCLRTCWVRKSRMKLVWSMPSNMQH